MLIFKNLIKSYICRYLLYHFDFKYLFLSNKSNDDVKKLLEENNVKYLFSPPYSPEYNPIELAWSKFKHFIKKVKPRCGFHLWLSIYSAIESISLDDINGYFKCVNDFYI
jgi:transposase